MQQRKLHLYQTGQDAYSLLTEYLSVNDKQQLKKQIETVTYPTDFVHHITQGKWLSLFTPDFPAQLLRSLYDGHINTMQYVTGQMFYNVHAHASRHEKYSKLERLFNEKNQLSINNKNKVEATMKLLSSSFKNYMAKAKAAAEARQQARRNSFWGRQQDDQVIADAMLADVSMEAFEKAEQEAHVHWASSKESDNFYRALQKMPASEQNFMLIEDPFFNGDTISDKTSVMQQINYRLGFNVFSRLRVDGKPMLMIPSAGMMEAFMSVTRSANRLPPIYRFGFSPLDGLYDAMKKGFRDKIICTPLLPQHIPTNADNYPAHVAYAEAEQHDFYHEYICGNIPYGDRKLFIEWIDAIRAFVAKTPDTFAYGTGFAAGLIDMEHRHYDPNIAKHQFLASFFALQSDSPHARFWSALEMCDVNAMIVARLMSANIKFTLTQLEAGRASLAKFLAEWLLGHENEFATRFGLSIESFVQHRALVSGNLLTLMQQHIHLLVSERLSGKNLKELYLMLYPHKPGPLTTIYIKTKMQNHIQDDVVNSILTAYQVKSTVLIDMITNELNENLLMYLRDGTIERLQKEYPAQLAYVMSEFRGSPYADEWVKKALPNRSRDNHLQVVDLLYDRSQINRVYPSDQKTLLHRALSAENVELMLRLTNDGARVDEVPGAVKPCAYADSMHTGRYELILILSYAYRYGAGWVDRFPEVVAKLRRMADFWNDPHDLTKNCDAELAWAQQAVMANPIPTTFLTSIDFAAEDRNTQETAAGVHRFFERMKSGEGVALDPADPDAEAFLRAKGWSVHGGALPSK